MRIIALILLSVISLTRSLLASEGSMAVLDLDARGISVVEAASLTDRLRSELVKTGMVTIVERAAMEQILREQDFQLAGCTSDECAVEVGQLLGVTQMLAGSIGRVGSTYSIDLRLVDVETGKIVKSVTHDYRGVIDDLLGQMTALAHQLVGIEHEGLPDLTAADPAPTQLAQPTVSAAGRSPLVKWLLLTAVAAGGGYLGFTLLADDGGGPAPEVGTPPALPEEPQ